MVVDLPGWIEARRVAIFGSPDDALSLVQVESEVVVAPVVRGNAFIDIAGDPTVLRFAAAAGGKAHSQMAEGPGVLSIARFGLPAPDRFRIVEDDLVPTERRLMTELPASREDFALFLAQRDAAEAELLQPAALNADDRAALEALGSTVDLGDLEDSAGAALPGLEADPIPDILAPQPAPVVPDILANPEALDTRPEAALPEATSVALVRPEAERRALFEDVVILAELERPLASVLADQKLPESLAPALAAALPGIDPLPRGAILGLRLLPEAGGGQRLSHLSLYGPQGHLGSVMVTAEGAATASVDPWIKNDLPGLATASLESANTADPDAQGPKGGASGYRLLDAVYSAAIRNGASSALAGELVAILAKAQDLERPAQIGDRITLAFSTRHGPGGTPAGQWLYAGVKPATEGGQGGFACYILPDKTAGAHGFACQSRSSASFAPAGGGGLLATPVAGIMTSKFGPRLHPILKTMRLHAGVDWAAPTGTPVQAAAAGKVVHAGDGRGYGNLVVIAHEGGIETRYAHLSRFAPGITQGALVQAGQPIGAVGTTGLSTGPHLHFEAHRAGTPIDPMPLLSGAVVAVVTAGSDAVEALVDRIVQVESGGVATAKNTRSTATGLGQFIESTWLRMMRDYRPDFVATMSREQLLALRTDPTLSREMVKRLAQENEAYLRGRGHGITSGWLYLAHFLGPEGANRVLSSQDGQTILAVMGAGVVNANPFLKDYTVADLKAWATRKMEGKGASVPATTGASAPVPVALPPEVEAYIALADQVLAAL
ncbi:MAG TPA: M23 family metallopeptidase [Gemmobacter sp.]|nr:M23 family metallopeptidase [Gemmobacter sp.]